MDEITLTCNPFFRYKELTTKQLKEKRLQSDSIKEFISYAIGCIFGRYSLDKKGLILANQGDNIETFWKKVLILHLCQMMIMLYQF